MLEDATLAAYFRVLGFDTNDADREGRDMTGHARQDPLTTLQ